MRSCTGLTVSFIAVAGNPRESTLFAMENRVIRPCLEVRGTGDFPWKVEIVLPGWQGVGVA